MRLGERLRAAGYDTDMTPLNRGAAPMLDEVLDLRDCPRCPELEAEVQRLRSVLAENALGGERG